MLVLYVLATTELLYADWGLYDPATGQTGIDAFGGNAVSQRGPAISIDLDLLMLILALIYGAVGASIGRWWGLVLALVPLAVAVPLSALAPSPDGDPSVMGIAQFNLEGTVPCIALGIGLRKWRRRRRRGSRPPQDPHPAGANLDRLRRSAPKA